MKINHSILLQCYNQEETIAKAIDSILNQTIQPLEIIISDDCSIDNTWGIICDYKARYPGIIIPYRNEKNLGVFENINKTLKYKRSGNIISFLGGDDYYDYKMIENINSVLSNYSIDFNRDKFLVVTNTVAVVNTRFKIIDNYQLKDKNIFKERLRRGFAIRGVGISNSLLESLDPFILNHGYSVDWLWGLQKINNCEKFYYCNCISSYYSQGVGVISNTQKKMLYESELWTLKQLRNIYNSKLDNNDKKYISYLESKYNYLMQQSLKTYINLLWHILYNFKNFGIQRPFIVEFTNLLPSSLRNIMKKVIKRN